MGRKSKYTPELVEEICERLSQGEPLESICRDDHMPCAMTVHDWKAGRVENVPESVSHDIARAREMGYDVIAANLRETARGKGESTDDVQRDKLIIDTDLKLLAKWTKKYSEKIDHSSSDGTMTPKTINCGALSNEVMEQLLKAKDATDTE